MRNQFKRLFSEKKYLFRMLCNDFTDKVIVNTAVMITLVSFLFMISGCSYYRSVTRVKEGSVDLLTETVNKFYLEFNFPRDQYPIADLYNLFFKEYNLYLIDSKGKWELSDIDIRNDTVYATAVLSSVPGDTLTDLPGDKTSVRYKQNKEIELLERVFIYTDKFDFSQGAKGYLSVNDISKVITFKNHPAAKVGFTLLIVGGLLTTAFVTLILVATSSGIEYDK